MIFRSNGKKFDNDINLDDMMDMQNCIDMQRKFACINSYLSKHFNQVK